MNVKKKLAELIESARYWGSNTSEEIADHLIANGITVHEWISVKNRLPEPWKQVLIYSLHDFCESAVYTGVPGKWRVTWNHEMLDADSVTHWMPLPSTEGLE